MVGAFGCWSVGRWSVVGWLDCRCSVVGFKETRYIEPINLTMSPANNDQFTRYMTEKLLCTNLSDRAKFSD